MILATPDELREIARMWDNSAIVCRTFAIKDIALGYSDSTGNALAERDRRIANAMRQAADLLEKNLIIYQDLDV
jgi:hypothetical protein